MHATYTQFFINNFIRVCLFFGDNDVFHVGPLLFYKNLLSFSADYFRICRNRTEKLLSMQKILYKNVLLNVRDINTG